MAYQTIFKRYELKYILAQEQKKKVLDAMAAYMDLDEFGRTTIRNIYFDTNNYRLIRHSIEKPAYKEKMRIRSYSQATPDSMVFVELKKKYNHVVYKRRICLPEKEAMEWVRKEKRCHMDTQISAEIDYFIDYYETLHPVVFLSYEREAFYSKDKSDFRVTFDDNILCRQNDLSLESEVYGTPILQEGIVLMEIKCSGGIPLWMAHVLSEEHIYKTSFSKYGTAYTTMILPKSMEVEQYA
ncbi:MAG: polyphosphate polymerase domain-containing protein [Lachnospiraceae bacterium]|nr:polyphosphate polymerase domain-containing protein [Lachnospiraceae bacterium]